MIRKAIVFILLLFLTTGYTTQAQERKIFDWAHFYRLTEGKKVNIVKILDTGEVLAIVEPARGKPIGLLWQNAFNKEMFTIDTPIDSLGKIAASRDGKNIVVYKSENSAFWHVDYASNWTLLAKRERGKSGFGLYGKNKSLLTYAGGKLYAWGYLYDEKGKFSGDALVKIDVDNAREGKGKVFKQVLSSQELVKIAKKHHPGLQGMGNVQIGGRYLTFTTLDKERGSQIIACDLKTKSHFLVQSFSQVVAVSIASNGNSLAYIITQDSKANKDQPQRKGILYNYDLKLKKRHKLLSGLLMHPVFNSTGDKLAVGKMKWERKQKNIHQTIAVIDLKKDEQISTYPLAKKQIYIDWQFVLEDKQLLLYNGNCIYCLDLE